MKIEIKHRFTGEVIFSIEARSWRLAVEVAVNAGANLAGAYLAGADLAGAYLKGANLREADLAGANLKGAYLAGAYLAEAYLAGADLEGAYLAGADLREADLAGANLAGAYLAGADLAGADLKGANLREADLAGANLKGAKNFNKYLTTPLYGLFDQPGPIVAYKLVTAKGNGPWNGGHYENGETYTESDASTDEFVHCARGLNVATLDWCLRNWQSGRRILTVEFTAKDIACIPVVTDGKFRVTKFKVTGEKDLKKLGLKL